MPENEIEPVAESLIDILSTNPDYPNVEIYGMFWILEALGQTNHISEGLAIIENYYGHLLASEATTWWEHFYIGLKSAICF